MIEAKKVQQLDFNLLKVFECLYQERNMSLAAKLLFISPSAVSHAIKRLRLVLNDSLLAKAKLCSQQPFVSAWLRSY